MLVLIIKIGSGVDFNDSFLGLMQSIKLNLRVINRNFVKNKECTNAAPRDLPEGKRRRNTMVEYVMSAYINTAGMSRRPCPPAEVKRRSLKSSQNSVKIWPNRRNMLDTFRRQSAIFIFKTSDRWTSVNRFNCYNKKAYILRLLVLIMTIIKVVPCSFLSLGWSPPCNFVKQNRK